MKLTIFSLIALFLVLAFAGVQPMTSYKDGAFSLVGSTFSSVSKSLSVKDDGNNKDLATVREPNPTPIKTPEPAPLVPNLPKEPEPSPEMVAFNLINAERVKAGLFPTVWDEELYKLSKAHTQEMANRKELFHSPMGGDIGEDAWGGYGYSRFSGSELAKVIVESWMSSPLHKAWILHAPIQHSVVSIVSVSDGQYVSWTFWTSEVGSGPILIQKAYDLWQKETGGQVDWIKWLYDVKGYPDNVEFLRELGIK